MKHKTSWVFALALLLFGTPAFSQSTCAELFEGAPRVQELTSAEVAEIARAWEQETREVIRSLRLTNDDARLEVRGWSERLAARQKSGAPSTLMEFTVLQLLLKTKYLESVTDAALEAELARSLEHAWLALTGEASTAPQIVRSSLPRRVIQKEPVQMQRFYRLAKSVNPETLAVQSPIARAFAARVLPMALLAVGFAQTGSSLLAGASMGYFVSLTVEYIWHRWVMHSDKEKREWFASKSFFQREARMSMSHFSHHKEMSAVKGSELYIKKSANVFDDPAVQRDVVPVLEADGMPLAEQIAYVEETGHGVTMEKVAVKNGIVTLMPFGFVMGYLVGGDQAFFSAAAGALTAASFIPHVNLMHGQMHVKREDVMQNGTTLQKWFLNTRYFRMITRYHYMHHVRSSANYSILPAGLDQLMNTVKRPDIVNVLDMLEADIFF